MSTSSVFKEDSSMDDSFKVDFNKPYLTGKEAHYLYQAVLSGKISGDGIFTKKCHRFFEERYKFGKCLLTTSCTDALEMAAILLDIQPGDEVIAPSYTFVSTVNPFILRGAKIVFADSRRDQPNIDENKIEELITPKTKAIVVVHYAGVACNMDRIKSIADNHQLFLIEDAAQAIDSYYNGRPVGSIGHMAAFSFHETKNIITGEGGMLVINDSRFFNRAEIIREKGTNRSAFFRGEVDKYGWVDIGSSFLPSEIIAAFLYAQLENIDDIQQKRVRLWNRYFEKLNRSEITSQFQLPVVPDYSSNNAHIFYILAKDLDNRTNLIKYLKDNSIYAVFHYLSLHRSQFFKDKHDGRVMPNADRYSECLIRLPMFAELSFKQIDFIAERILAYCAKET